MIPLTLFTTSNLTYLSCRSNVLQDSRTFGTDVFPSLSSPSTDVVLSSNTQLDQRPLSNPRPYSPTKLSSLQSIKPASPSLWNVCTKTVGQHPPQSDCQHIRWSAFTAERISFDCQHNRRLEHHRGLEILIKDGERPDQPQAKPCPPNPMTFVCLAHQHRNAPPSKSHLS